MQKNILIAYSSVDGHTVTICERIREICSERDDHQVKLLDIEALSDPAMDSTSFDTIVIGASIRYGKHRKAVVDFIDKNLPALRSKPSAFFSVNLIARKPQKRLPEQNTYVRKFLNRISWKPNHVEVFAGLLDYQRYPFLDRLMIQLIMKMTKGPTDPKARIDYTDWKQVERFANEVNQM